MDYTNYPSVNILELQEDGSTREAKLELTSQTPYSCNRKYTIEDLKSGHGFPNELFSAKLFLTHNVELGELNSYDIIFMLEPYFESFKKRGIYRRLPDLFEDEPKKWKLVNNDDFRLCLIEEFHLSDYFGK